MSTKSALSNRPFRFYFIASIFGTLAVWLMRFVFSWLIWAMTESFFWVGVGSAGLLVPSLIITPIAGVLSDRVDLKRAYVIWLLGQSAIALITLLILSFWQQQLALILTLVFVFGIVQAAGSPLRLTLIPKLVTPAQLPNAVGLGAIVFNTSRIVAPALAAGLLTRLSAEQLFLFSALLFAAAALMNRALPAIASAPASTTTGWQDFQQGLQYAMAQPLVRLLFALTLMNALVARSIMELLPAISGTLASGTPADLATLTACAGVGSILGGVVVSRLSGREATLFRLLVLSLCITAVSIAPLHLPLSLPLMGGAIGTISMMMTLMGTSSQILLQLNCEDGKRGRVMSLWLTLAIAGPAFGALLMGSLAEWAGVSAMLVLMMLISLISAAILWQQRSTWQHQRMAVEP